MCLSVETRRVSLPYRRAIFSKADFYFILGYNCEWILGSANSKCYKVRQDLGKLNKESVDTVRNSKCLREVESFLDSVNGGSLLVCFASPV